MGSSQNIGTIFALITFISWGVFPIYWKLLNRIDPIELTCHRGIWTFLAALSIALITKKGHLLLGYLRDKKMLLSCLILGTLLGFNWFLFVSAVQNERVLEVSFGYYINPIMSVLIGIFYFKEQTSRWEKVAIAIALAAILYIGIGYGEMPWYAILLASSFALYGAIKKKQPAVNFASLSLEFFFIMLGGLPYLIYLLWVGENTFFQGDVALSLLIASTGLITIGPLYFFSKSTQLIPLSKIGFIQYLAPSITFLLGVFLFKEPLAPSKLISFGMIWTALSIYTYAQIKKQRKALRKSRLQKNTAITTLIAFCCSTLSCDHTPEFQRVAIDTLPLNLQGESIRALEIKDGKVFYAGLRSVGYFAIDPQKPFDEVAKERLYPGDTVGYRSLAVVQDAYLFMSIGSPAKLYRRDMKNNTLTVVYREDDPKAFYDSMKFWNELEGICVGDPVQAHCPAVLITRDGGKSWQKVGCQQLPNIAQGEAFFAASNTCIAIQGDQAWLASGGTQAQVLHTPDKGKSWHSYPTPIRQGGSTEGIFSIAFYDATHGVIFGGDYKSPQQNTANKAWTQDGGKTWTLISDGNPPDYRSCVQFIPKSGAKGLLALGFRGIDLSQDGGKSWKNISQDSSFYTVRFADRHTAYAAGKETIARLTLKTD